MTDNDFVILVQKEVGVEADGIPGPKTVAALMEALGRDEPAPEPVPAPPLSAASLAKLENVHYDLVKVIRLAAQRSPYPFVVLEGVRSLARQKELVASGASTTMKSRHLPHAMDGLSRAVDIAPLGPTGQVSWDWPLYHKLAPIVKAAAKELGVPIEWGGDWRSFKDGPHWQLPWGSYP